LRPRDRAAQRALFALLCTGFGLGCGGGEANRFGRDAGPDAIAGGRALGSLTQSEQIALCDEVQVYLASVPIPPAGGCRVSGFLTAQSLVFAAPNISDAALQTECVLAYAACLEMSPGPSMPPVVPIGCLQFFPGCTTTVDQHWTCLRDLVELEHARARSVPLCHLITRAVVEGLTFDAGAGPAQPPSCAVLHACVSF
jgi:hypothetical protein